MCLLVPYGGMDGVWHVHFAVALNIGSMGFFWWRIPEQVSRYYEKITDLEGNMEIGVERSPALQIDWGKRALTAADLNNTAMCFAKLPKFGDREKHKPFDYYVGGLTFLSLNDVHWQCEQNVFGNFFHSLKAGLQQYGYWEKEDQFRQGFDRFLDEILPEFDERDKYFSLGDQLSAGKEAEPKITLSEAAMMKLLCDAFYLKTFRDIKVE